MGAVHAPPIRDLALLLTRHFGIKDFVETGTFSGRVLEWAAANFERVRTIELRPDFKANAQAKWGHLANVEFILGDSAEALGQVCPQLTGPALFWLDAHMGTGYFSTEDYCPLLAEIRHINASPFEHCLLIDDARAFLAPPPPPFDYRKWPTLEEIILELHRARPWHVAVFEDTLICVPPSARDILAQFLAPLRGRLF